MHKNQGDRSTIVMGWLFLAVAILLLTVVYPNQIIVKGSEIVSSRFFPKLCAYALIILSFWFLLDGYRGRGRSSDQAAGDSQLVEYAAREKAALGPAVKRIPPIVLAVGLCLACIVAMQLLGFIITCFAFLTLSFKRGGMRTYWKPALISAIITAALYVVFRVLMLIVLPKGLLVTWLLGLF